MWYSDQTLLHRETKRLWVFTEEHKHGYWAWLFDENIPMANEAGEIHLFPSKEMTQLFVAVCDETGKALQGTPVLNEEKDKIIKPDISLY